MIQFRQTLAAVCVLLISSQVQTRGDTPNPAKGAKATSVSDRLVIREWGTFTCLQDEMGQAIVGVNTDDEPVPKFVHRIAELIPRPTELAPVYHKKGLPRLHRQVRMRLETPIVYFHPPPGMAPLHAGLQVEFRGGWLSEYYPVATVSAPGLKEGNFRFAGLTPTTRGSLDWQDLTIGGDDPLPQTDAPVWLAPRAVEAASVKAPTPEEGPELLKSSSD